MMSTLDVYRHILSVRTTKTNIMRPIVIIYVYRHEDNGLGGSFTAGSGDDFQSTERKNAHSHNLTHTHKWTIEEYDFGLQ